MKTILIRPAMIGDIAAILNIKQNAWPDVPVSATQLGHVLNHPHHTTLVAERHGTLVGFLDSFLTTHAGIARWELDLLAVSPTARRLGIGRALLAASLDIGWQQGATLARGLIHHQNQPSQALFQQLNFTPAGSLAQLWIKTAPPWPHFPPWVRQLPVDTINYHGLWLEGPLDGPKTTPIITNPRPFDLLGTVLPLNNTAAETFLTKAGFTSFGHYQWWSRPHPNSS
ncbi:MAG TPA: GNAT family N-acetyltransferase [Anaerolineae bacterium]|nr:GNAT family N-acetyltransferase [Anaerolineae bacterium]